MTGIGIATKCYALTNCSLLKSTASSIRKTTLYRSRGRSSFTKRAGRGSSSWPERSRDRILSDGELRLIWYACDEITWPFGPLTKILLLTGQRRDEVAEMCWSEVDFEKKLWVIPRERVKNGVAHEVPLSDAVASLLKCLPHIKNRPGLVFTTTGESAVGGFSRAKDRLDAAVLELMRKDATAGHADSGNIDALTRWTFHDHSPDLRQRHGAP